MPGVAWVLFIATVVWAVVYDTMYAMADRDDDLWVGIKSTAVLFGRHDRLIIAALQLLMLALLWWVASWPDAVAITPAACCGPRRCSRTSSG
jgi:4-hydroxybenzoate polyprenyltransferase